MRKILEDLFKTAIDSAYGKLAADCDPSIQATVRSEFGDYQANFALRLAKTIHKNPTEIAKEVIAKLNKNKIIEKIEPSGPGFINIFLTNEFLAQRLQLLIGDERLGVQQQLPSEIAVVDYGSANVAKEMHVGHIRSIVIGDAIVRILSFLGFKVIRQNHLGDWGTQFGMLIEYLYELSEQNKSHSVQDLDALYKKSKERFDSDAKFADNARSRVVALQSGDPETLSIWNKLVEESLNYCQEIYDQLDVLLTKEDARGESFYNPMLAEIVDELEKKNMTEISEGALVIFLEGYRNLDGTPLPLIIRKKDGGYLYATTDLAAAKFRIENLGAKRIIYVTDARQKQHFSMIFLVVQKAGWTNKEVRLEHIPFGAILGKDHRPFKTRSGESIKLISLLEEAENKAMALALEKNLEFTESEFKDIAHDIGIGALKYADLRADKIKDYVFDWEKLLSFEGNTAPYLQNAYVRICAIFRKGNVSSDEIKNNQIILTTEIEHALAIKILEFPEIIHLASEQLAPHRLCDYLYDLAATYHRFYEHCPILSNEEKSIRDSRLLISHLTARTLKQGLNLLGIKTLEKM